MRMASSPLPLVPSSPEFSLTLSSSEPISTFPFKVKRSNDPNRSQVSFVPWTKAQLGAIVKQFPKLTEDPYKFSEKFDIVIQTYQPGFSDLYQIIHVLVGEG